MNETVHIDKSIRVIDESPDWIVVDKPPFLQVHPSKPGGPFTLWDGLKELLAFELVNGGQVSIINRLDRETSGLTLVCKNAAAARKYFAAHGGWTHPQGIRCHRLGMARVR